MSIVVNDERLIMRKQIKIFALIIVVFLMGGCSLHNKLPENESDNTTESVDFSVKAVWLTVYEIAEMINGSTEDEFIKEINSVAQKCTENGINTVFVHVRAFNDSLYPSKYVDWTSFLESEPSYDPLKIMVDMFNKNGISVHAWLNPYRISYDNKYTVSEVIADFSFSCNKGVYLQPSSVYSMKLILCVVRELMENYNIDGIHFDDYFYPDTNDYFDKNYYDEYVNQGGLLTLDDWRRENVNTLIGSVYSLVHKYNENAIFSISPASDLNKNFSCYYADIALWMKNPGYADWIIPQIYFGFEHQSKPFTDECQLWINLERNNEVKLICGLASYKNNKVDDYAGDGKNEWVEQHNIIERQIDWLKNNQLWSGYSLFSYNYL